MLTLVPRKSSGFTIVELLIVIVVIGILAAITIVAYNGVTNNAQIANAKAGVIQIAQKLSVYKAQNNDTYPAGTNTTGTISNMLGAIGVPTSSNVTAYLTDPGGTNFCVTVTNGSNSYSASSTAGNAMLGTCVENIAIDPSAAGDPSHFSASGGSQDSYSNVSISSSQAQSGTTSLAKTVSASYANGASATVYTSRAIPANTTTFYSFWVYTPRAMSVYAYADQYKQSDNSYGCGGTNTFATFPVSATTWTKFSVNMTPTSACYINAGGFNIAANVGETVYFDSYMVTIGGSYAYGDGNSAGWFWEGTPNNSASIGPAIPQ